MKFQHLDEKKIDELLEIVERNRWDRLRKLGIDDQGEDEEGDEEKDHEDTELSADDVRVVLFGAQSAFVKSMIEMIASITVVTHFEIAEEMIEFCLNHNVSCILIDIDLPTDCYQATDVYVALAMLLPDIRKFICTKKNNTIQAEILKARGASLATKPILRKQLDILLKGITLKKSG